MPADRPMKLTLKSQAAIMATVISVTVVSLFGWSQREPIRRGGCDKTCTETGAALPFQSGHALNKRILLSWRVGIIYHQRDKGPGIGGLRAGGIGFRQNCLGNLIQPGELGSAEQFRIFRR